MNLQPLFPSRETLGIHTDLYELTMLAAYFEAAFAEERASFELFNPRACRRRGAFCLPPGWNRRCTKF